MLSYIRAKFCLHMAGTRGNSFECTECAPNITCHIVDRDDGASPRKEWKDGEQKVVQGGCVWFNKHRNQILDDAYAS